MFPSNGRKIGAGDKGGSKRLMAETVEQPLAARGRLGVTKPQHRARSFWHVGQYRNHSVVHGMGDVCCEVDVRFFGTDDHRLAASCGGRGVEIRLSRNQLNPQKSTATGAGLSIGLSCLTWTPLLASWH